MGTVTIGAMSLSVDVLVVLAALLLATTVGNRVARSSGTQVESMLWASIALALLVARTAYVLNYHDAYLASPTSVLNIRDGGWTGWAGVVAGIASIAWLSWRHPARRNGLLAAAAAGLVVWFGAALLAWVQPSREVGIPAVVLRSLRGEAMRLQAFHGKPLVVNLWASWCPPCRREMPLLREAQVRHPEMNFVFVNQMESADAVRRYLDDAHIDLDNVLLDQHSALSAATGTQGIPATLFFDAGGRLVERRIGELSAASLTQRVDSISEARSQDGARR